MTREDRMLEKASWSESPVRTFRASCDSETVKEVSSSTYDDATLSTHGTKSGTVDETRDFCEEHTSLGDKYATADKNLYCYPLNHISQTGNDLKLLENDCEDKESSDLLYYGWPDIGNFEDVDRMFRSCDSTFGLGSLSNEEDLCWFAPENAAEDSEDILESGSKLKTLSGHLEPPSENGADSSTNDCNQESFTASDKMNFKSIASDESALNHMSFGNGLDTPSENMDVIMSNDQRNLHNESEGTRRFVENDGSVGHYASQNQLADMEHLFGDSSLKMLSPSGLGQHEENFARDSLNYLQEQIPYMHLDYSHPSERISVCPTPSIKSENNHPMSPSPKESPYASNQMQFTESFHDHSFEAPSVTTNEEREKPFHCQGAVQVPFCRNFKHGNITNAMAFGNSLPVLKQVQQSEQQTEGHGKVEGVSVPVCAEMDSPNAQESSCVSSVLDEISLEATSFRQLQQITEKLDIRTKLCLRDSLYRLAKNAEQRHNCANSSARIGFDRDAAGAVMSEKTNKCPVYIEVETDTNPIDRSIAHLLFHRPPDPSVTYLKDSLPFKPHAMIHSSINSHSVNGGKQVCRKDTSTNEINSDR